MDPERTNREWHATLRRRDSDDIAAGRRTPEEVNRVNAGNPNPRDWEIRNLSQATRALRRQR